MTLFRSDHARYRVLRQQRIGVAREFEGAEQVDLEDLAPLVLGVLGAGSGEVAAGIVDQDVEAFVLVFDPVEQLAALFVVGDVGDQGADVAVGEFFGQFVASAFEAVAVARGNQHAGAEAEQLARDRQADAGAAAGYKRQLSVQSPAVRVHCGLPFRVARSIAPRPIEDAAMPRSLATSPMIPGALLLALACAACTRPPPPPPDQPPEPQANTPLRYATHAPIDRASAGAGAVRARGGHQRAEVARAASGGRG